MATPPRKLSPRHRTAARLVAAGQPSSEIASMLGAHVSTVRHWRRSPPFKAALAEYRRKFEAAAIAEYAKRMAQQQEALRGAAESSVGPPPTTMREADQGRLLGGPTARRPVPAVLPAYPVNRAAPSAIVRPSPPIVERWKPPSSPRPSAQVTPTPSARTPTAQVHVPLGRRGFTGNVAQSQPARPRWQRLTSAAIGPVPVRAVRSS